MYLKREDVYKTVAETDLTQLYTKIKEIGMTVSYNESKSVSVIMQPDGTLKYRAFMDSDVPSSSITFTKYEEDKCLTYTLIPQPYYYDVYYYDVYTYNNIICYIEDATGMPIEEFTNGKFKYIETVEV